jgi:anti-anti-sigma factor
MAFSVASETNNGVAKVTVIGELDASVAGEFRDSIDKLAADKPRCLVLMLDQLTFMASAGLRVLVFAKQRMGSGVDLYVIGAHDAVLDTLTMTGFHHSVIMLPEYDASIIEQA